jgi:hypothetical protein
MFRLSNISLATVLILKLHLVSTRPSLHLVSTRPSLSNGRCGKRSWMWSASFSEKAPHKTTLLR